MKSLLPLLFVLLSLLASGQVAADHAAGPLPERYYGNVAYLSGGVGEEELEVIRASERNFNLKLLFAERGGAYLGGVDVLLINAAGDTAFDGQGLGPFLLLRLPSGSYEVRATANGEVRKGRLSVTTRGRHEAVFRW